MRTVLLSSESVQLTLVYGPVTDGMESPMVRIRRMYRLGASITNGHSGMATSHRPVALSDSSASGESCRSETWRVSSYSRRLCSW